MTWFYWFSDDGKNGHVADHNGDELPNSPWHNPDGWSWDGDYPDAIVDVMMDEAVRQITENGDVDYFATASADAIKDDIELGQPPA